MRIRLRKSRDTELIPEPATPKIPSLHKERIWSQGWGPRGYYGLDGTTVDNEGGALFTDFYPTIDDAQACARYTMNSDQATSTLIAPDEFAGFRIEDDSRVLDEGLILASSVLGPLVLKCIDGQGAPCPIEDTCSYKTSVDSHKFVKVGAPVTVRVKNIVLDQTVEVSGHIEL